MEGKAIENSVSTLPLNRQQRFLLFNDCTMLHQESIRQLHKFPPRFPWLFHCVLHLHEFFLDNARCLR